MRTTVACESRSKVKCAHTGSAPCRGCIKSQNTPTCVLTGTVKGRGEPLKPRRITSNRRRLIPSHRHDPGAARVPENRQGSSSTVRNAPENDIADHFEKVETREFAQAVATFRTQFPEHGFFHPLDLEGPPADVSDHDRLRWLACLAIGSKYMGEDSRRRGIEHSDFVGRKLPGLVIASPTLSLVQSFLLIALYEWGDGHGYTAWMCAGVAMRMAQAYRGAKLETYSRGLDPRSGIGTRNLHVDKCLSEIEIRTLWSCFVVDKWLSCGKQRPSMMPLEYMRIRMPQRDEDFVFGVQDDNPITYDQLAQDPGLRRRCGTMDDYSRIIIQGLEIWSNIHDWVVNGGRRQPGMLTPANCPWKPESVWGKLKNSLEQWRDEQDVRMRYPETKVSIQVHFKRGEVFVYTNLLYYLCTIFMNREFIPFLSAPGETEPRGPLDPPFYPEDAPEGWWANNVREIRDAGALVTSMMRELRTANASLCTPFVGLNMVTVAVVNLYVAHFPSTQGPNGEAEVQNRLEMAAENCEELRRVREIWPLADEWVQVVEIIWKLMKLVSSGKRPASSVRRSRYDYVPLEASLNYAPPRGKLDVLELAEGADLAPVGSDMEGSARGARKTAGESEGLDLEGRSNHQQPSGSSQGPTSDGLQEEGLMQEEDWQLWSLLEDPHLVAWDPWTLLNLEQPDESHRID